MAYTCSKLANALYAMELSRRLAPPAKVTVAAYDPGFIGNTGLMRGLGFLQPVAKFVIESLIYWKARWHRVPNQNSTLERSCLFLASMCVDQELTKSTGIYYSIDHECPVSDLAASTANQDDLTRFSRALLAEKGFPL